MLNVATVGGGIIAARRTQPRHPMTRPKAWKANLAHALEWLELARNALSAPPCGPGSALCEAVQPASHRTHWKGNMESRVALLSLSEERAGITAPHSRHTSLPVFSFLIILVSHHTPMGT